MRFLKEHFIFLIVFSTIILFATYLFIDFGWKQHGFLSEEEVAIITENIQKNQKFNKGIGELHKVKKEIKGKKSTNHIKDGKKYTKGKYLFDIKTSKATYRIETSWVKRNNKFEITELSIFDTLYYTE